MIVTSDLGASTVLQARDSEESFSTIELFILKDRRSKTSRFRPLRDLLNRRSLSAKEKRQENGFLFSAEHWVAFFASAVAHIAHDDAEPFDFVQQSNEVDDDFAEHVGNFLKLTAFYKLSYEIAASFIASTILMDAYPPGMHGGFGGRSF